MMTLRNPGRLAIHRRSAEIDFLEHLLRAGNGANFPRDEHGPNEHEPPSPPKDEEQGASMAWQVHTRQRALADELLHLRQTEPLGEALQRRLAMAELISGGLGPTDQRSQQMDASYRTAEIERQALADMLQRWWAWLRTS